MPEGRGPGLGDRGVLARRGWRRTSRAGRRRRPRPWSWSASVLRYSRSGSRRANSSAAGWAAQPASRSPTGDAVGCGRRGDDPVGAGLPGDVGGRVGAGLAAVGLGVEGQVAPAGQGDLERDLGVIERAVLGVADAARTSRRRARSRRPSACTAISTRPGTSPTSQRTVCRHERSRSLSAGSARRRPQRQRSPIIRAATCPLPNDWATSAGRSWPAGSLTSERTDGPRLDVADLAEHPERAHRGQPLLLLVLGLAGPDPGLEPAFAGEDQAVILLGARVGGAVAPDRLR